LLELFASDILLITTEAAEENSHEPLVGFRQEVEDPACDKHSLFLGFSLF